MRTPPKASISGIIRRPMIQGDNVSQIVSSILVAVVAIVAKEYQSIGKTQIGWSWQ